jgi:acetyl esterase/lipase
MTNILDKPALPVPERLVPVPRHLSPEAQAFLSAASPGGAAPYPALDDAAAWRRHIAAGEEAIVNVYFANVPRFDGTIVERREQGALAYDIAPAGLRPDDRRVYLYIHGGALIMGSGEACKIMSCRSASQLGVRMVSVDYRMPPDHPYPAGLDDCLVWYRALLRDHAPEEIVVGGGSAGGNLAAALILRARDEGLPLPAAAVLISPELDLTESGDSFFTNAGIDAMGSLMAPNRLYAGDAALDDPYVSPLFGDFARGFPPTIVTAGTRDLFLSNAVRMHRALRKAGIEAELHVIEAAPHGGFAGGSPEEEELDADVRRFCEKHWVTS